MRQYFFGEEPNSNFNISQVTQLGAQAVNNSNNQGTINNHNNNIITATGFLGQTAGTNGAQFPNVTATIASWIGAGQVTRAQPKAAAPRRKAPAKAAAAAAAAAAASAGAGAASLAASEALEKSRKYVNKDAISPHLYCSICQDVFWNPVCAVPCGHTFCDNCLREYRTFKKVAQPPCPECRTAITLTHRDFVANKFLHDVEVFCAFSGCVWVGKMDELSFHASECALRPDRVRSLVGGDDGAEMLSAGGSLVGRLLLDSRTRGRLQGLLRADTAGAVARGALEESDDSDGEVQISAGTSSKVTSNELDEAASKKLKKSPIGYSP